MEVIESFQPIHSFPQTLLIETPSCQACGNRLSPRDSPEEDQFPVPLPERLEDKVVRECVKCFRGNWSATENITVEKICSGLSNYLFICSLSEGKETVDYEPRKVLVRIYGEIHRSNIESVIVDSVLFAVLSEKKMGPKLYGVFKGGRIEEFIESRPLSTRELQDPEVSRQIATNLASLHKLDMPLKKQPKFVFDNMTKWLEGWNNTAHNVLPNDTIELLDKSLLADELQWIKSAFFNSGSHKFPIIFCHNDLQENNILYVQDTNSPVGFHLQFIDFEYSSYNFRAFDFGNHFNEFCYDYTSEKWPCFTSRPMDFPSTDAQIRFWRTYCSANEDAAKSSDDEFLEEVYYGSLLSHLFWCLWSLMQQQISSIPFGYLEYAVCRFNAYQKLKQEGPPCPRWR